MVEGTVYPENMDFFEISRLAAINAGLDAYELMFDENYRENLVCVRITPNEGEPYFYDGYTEGGVKPHDFKSIPSESVGSYPYPPVKLFSDSHLSVNLKASLLPKDVFRVQVFAIYHNSVFGRSFIIPSTNATYVIGNIYGYEETISEGTQRCIVNIKLPGTRIDNYTVKLGEPVNKEGQGVGEGIVSIPFTLENSRPYAIEVSIFKDRARTAMHTGNLHIPPLPKEASSYVFDYSY